MPNLTEQLKRDGHLLAKSPRPKKQPKRIPAMSAKRKKEAAIYSKKRKAFLAKWPACQALIATVCFERATDIHHMEGRLKGNYLNESTWLPVCRDCHNWIHSHPTLARTLGLLV